MTTVNIPQNIVVTTVPTGCTSKTSPSSTQVTCKLSVLNANKTNQYVVGIKASAASLNFISATVTEDQSDVNNTNNSTNIYITSK